MDLSRTASPRPHLRRRTTGCSALLGGVLLLAACGGGDVDPTDAETGIVTEAPADPAASPTDSADPLTGSSP